MSKNLREAKIYGAVETEDHIVFEGFCKKIYSDENQCVNVFIDEEKIDTINANINIEYIERKYDVFDTSNFCFRYKLDSKYLGHKYKIAFKTVNGDELVNSPLTTLHSGHKGYREYKFNESIHSFTENILDYKKNQISFFINKKTVRSSSFKLIINKLYEKGLNLQGICLNDEYLKEFDENFSNIEVTVKKIDNFKDLLENTEILIDQHLNFKNDFYQKVITNCPNILLAPYSDHFNAYKLKLIEIDPNMSKNDSSYKSLIELGVSAETIEKSNFFSTTAIVNHIRTTIENKDYIDLSNSTNLDLFTSILEQSLIYEDAKKFYQKIINQNYLVKNIEK